MKLLISILVAAVFIGCSESAEVKLSSFEHHKKDQHEFMLSESSPLEKEDRKKFIALNYFPEDSSFIFEATYQAVFNGEIVEFETNTERRPIYIHAANISFTYEGKVYQLQAFLPQNAKDKNLFVPFNDLTNGNQSYKSGRYLDLEIPDGENIELNFNLAYNPYCAYNKKYSCPIPPSKNRVPIRITAGEKKYH